MSELLPEQLAGRIAGLSPAKRALLELRLRERSRAAAPGTAPIPRRASRDTAPLSFAQQRIWFLEQLQPGTGLYNVASRIRLQGVLHPDALARAVEGLVARHESLRTTFPAVDGQPFQVIAETVPVEVPVLDLAELPEAEREATARRLAAEEVRRPFDLAQGPLFRTRLLRLGPEEHLLLVSLHHIVSDAWSMGVWFRELGALYEGFTSGTTGALPELPVQYADYAAWQREWLQGEALDSQLAYWRDQFRSEPAPLPLPVSRARPEHQTHAGGRVRFSLPADLAGALEALGRQEGATLFMTLLAAFKALLSRYTGMDDVVVGSPIAGRTRTELEGLIGFFVNTLALRTDLSGDPTFRELVRRVRAVSLGAFAHQDLPFERLVEDLQPERDLNRNPLFQVVFALQNAPRSGLQLPGLKLGLMDVDREQSKFDLVLSVTQRQDTLRAKFVYSTALFDHDTVARMAGHYETLLRGAAADPERRLSALPFLGDADRRELALERNATDKVAPPPCCVHELIERHVAQTPDATVASGQGRELSYRELDRQANRLARRLRGLGVGPETRVGLCMGHSLELLVSILGTLKAGGAYVPLDPAYPRDRLAFMMADASVRVLVLGPGGADRIHLNPLPPAVRDVICLSLDEDQDEPADDVGPGSGVDPDNLAYVMYTSGSTGMPKGVATPHRAVASFSRAAADAYRLTSGDRVLHLSSIGSDISTDEIFPAWVSGAAVVLSGARPAPGAEFVDLLRRERVSAISLPTAFWHAWVLELHERREPLPATLRLVIVGGEQVQAPALAKWREAVGDGIRWLNTYGPTESTVQATLHEPGTGAGVEAPSAVPIGRPVANARVYVADRNLNLLPAGAAGELCIGGPGVARGYLDRPALTAAKFIPDPFGAEPGARLYRTGDRVRYRPDGELEFLGRTDHQVKIRGYRIEPGEIEAALARHPAVADCVVSAPEMGVGERRLVAYVVPAAGESPATSELVEFLERQLPGYMIPSDFVRLDALPLTPNAKVDRKALPAVDGTRPDLPTAFAAPRGPLEESIAAIWAAVLKVDRVGVHDNFFRLGGHSLLATQVVSRVRAACGSDLPLRALFESPTVAGLAEQVEAISEPRPGQPPPLVRLPRDGQRGVPAAVEATTAQRHPTENP